MKYRFVVRMLNMRSLSSVAMNEACPLMWQRMHGPSPEPRYAHASATFCWFQSARFMQPDHSAISCAETCPGVGCGVPVGGGVGEPVLRAATSASSHAAI